jgi:hypothetical protein
MAVFVLLTTFLIQKGSPESRRPDVKELVDTDPRDFADDPDAPWPVRRGGWILAALRAFPRSGVRSPLLVARGSATPSVALRNMPPTK